jgi:hypothetical protein
MILAQMGNPMSDAAGVPRLPDPPFLAYYLLENPWPPVTALAIGAAIAVVVLGRQGKQRQGTRAAAAALGLAGILLVLAYSVTTDREVLRRATRNLVDLTAAADTTGLRDQMTDQVRVGAFGGQIPGLHGRDDVLTAVRRYLGDQYPLESHQIGFVQAVMDGPNIARTQVRVWVNLKKDQQMYGAATGMWFRIEWRRDGNSPWRASVITIMQIDGFGINSEMGRD